jgi:hypothetical protein
MSNVPSNAEIITLLQEKLPKFKYGIRVGRFVDIKQSFFVGASVIPRKDGLTVNGNFPSAGASMSFTLFMIATGILIGLILWLAVWRGAQNKVRDEVAEVLKAELGS